VKLDQVSQYKYLGSWVTEDGRCEKEVKTRIAMAKDAFWKHKELLKGDLSLETKKRMLECYVFSVLKYGCESWTLSKVLSRRISAFEQWCYRRMLKVSWTEKRTNLEILQQIKENDMHFAKNIAQQKMAFAGHVLRGSSGMNALVILEGKIEGTRAQGRPRRMWMDDVRQWTKMKEYGEIKRSAEDREKWRTMARQPSYIEDGT
jgi:hypothetical protein